MLRNLVNAHDAALLVEKARQGRLRELLARASSRREAATMSWNAVSGPRKNWWDIPAVMRRWNAMVTGDADVDYLAHVLGSRFAGRRSMRALSLGCGTGHREIELARGGVFTRIDAIDRSAARIAYARERAREAGFGEAIAYTVGDAARFEAPAGSYDLVICEQFLHHVAVLDSLLRRVRDALRGGGLFLFNEFVGPSRFQWTDAQLAAVNAMLDELPERYRVRWKSGTIKRGVHRPGRLAMMLYDPTEAVSSSRIVPLVRRTFDAVEIRGYGGSLLPLLFSDIAFNFLSDDPETRELLARCFAREDDLLARGTIAHDYAVGICGRR
jgi:2-polyprenyl-3-methyl-5-hydroxy-6-metoxy-1,4-benzoquinol methylase